MPLTILLAEDDEGTRLSICDYLELDGYSVVMAANGEEALRKVFDDLPQLIITDIGMPFLDGLLFDSKGASASSLSAIAGGFSYRPQ